MRTLLFRISTSVCMVCIAMACACTARRPLTPSTAAPGSDVRVQFASQRTITTMGAGSERLEFARVREVEGRLVSAAADSIVIRIDRLTDNTGTRSLSGQRSTTVKFAPDVAVDVVAIDSGRTVVVTTLTLIGLVSVALVALIAAAFGSPY